MSEKLEIRKSDVLEYMESTWNTYASQSYKGKRLVLKIRLDGLFKVHYDGVVLYRGTKYTDAVRAWDGAE